MGKIIRSHRPLVGLLSVLLGLFLVCMLLLIRYYPYPWNFTTLPRLTQTAAGTAGTNGDPINLVLVGSEEQIAQSFYRAGWLTPDPITPQTMAKIAADSLAHRSYPTAPVSNLYVFGRVQDLAFEKPTNDIQNRGHIRLWQTGTRVSGQLIWVGQTSYDSGIELSATSHFPTHHITPTVDFERNSVGADLEKTGLIAAEADATFTAPIFAARNGGGDFYESDGDVLLINYTAASLPLHQQTVVLSGLKNGVFLVYDILVTGRGVLVALLVIGAVVIAGLVLFRVTKRNAPRQRS
jgi:LssY C-terminus